MYAFPDLRARSDQSVAVYHCSFIHVCTRVNEHGRHADYAGGDIRAVANAGPARHDAHAIVSGKLSNRIGVLVEELEGAIRGRHVDNRAHAEAHPYAALDPRICLPCANCVSLCCTNLTAIECRFELSEDGELFVRVFSGLARCQLLDIFTQWHAHSPAVQVRRSLRECA